MFAPAQDSEHADGISSIARFFEDVFIKDDDGVGAEYEVALGRRRLGAG
jgi:hypothetical protein